MSGTDVISVELILIIVCACVPTFKPIYDHHYRRPGPYRKVEPPPPYDTVDAPIAKNGA